jgi:ATP-binding cassette subfamily B protein
MTLVRFLFHNLKDDVARIIIAIGLTFVEVAADVLSAFPLKIIIDKLTLNINPNFPGSVFLLSIFQNLGPQRSVIIVSILLILFFGLISAGASYVQFRVISSIAENLTLRLRKQLYDHLQRLPLDWHWKHNKEYSIQILTGGMVNLEKFVSEGMIDLLAGTLIIVVVIIVMLSISWQFTILSLFILPILFILVYMNTLQHRVARKEEKKAEQRIADFTDDTVDKIMEIKAFTSETIMSERFGQLTLHKFTLGKDAGKLEARFPSLVSIVLAIGTFIIVSIGATAAANPAQALPLGIFSISPHTVTLGTLTVFLAYLTKLYQPMSDFSKSTTLIADASTTAEKIDEILQENTEPFETGNGRIPPTFKGAIRYENVSFTYPPRNSPEKSEPITAASQFQNPEHKPAGLHAISLEIPAGQRVALVGGSGSGKTTLTKLLLRLHEIPPGQGAITIDGNDIRNYSLRALRQSISFVPQDSILFNDTYSNNIAFGNPKADLKEIRAAADMACIGETIAKKKDGYNTQINTKIISGGERQRIAIARALLRKAPIMILDEPTASLDSETEAEVMSALYNLGGGRTLVMITHRLTILTGFDKIFVLHKGKIVEQGTFQELVKAGGRFANLWEKQKIPDFDKSELSIAGDAKVIIEINGQVVSSYVLDKPVLTIGRARECDIQIPYGTVSRLHAMILWQNGTWVMKDKDSTNGLKLSANGDWAPFPDEGTLKDGARIYLTPEIVIRYVQGNAPVVPPNIAARQPQPAHRKARISIELDGEIVGTRELDKDELIVGSHKHADIWVPSENIRALHAKIQRVNNSWIIIDTENNNGLIYNGKVVKQHVFADGDSISLARGEFLHYRLVS